jgi:ubiquinol-cytochrome c reductase cytochrome c subunit
MHRRLLLLLVTLLVSAAFVQVASAQEGPGDPVRGGELYVENCAVCHGVDGQGRIGASLEDFQGIDAGASMEAVIAAGVPGSVMPAWGQSNGGPLSDQDILDITSYVLAAFAGTQPLQPLPTYIAPTIERLPDVEGNPSDGAAVYHANCAMCHGDQGQGRFGLALAKAWPVAEPAVYIQQVVGQGIDGTTMPAWARSNGGPLSDDDIADVAAFVLTLEPSAAPAPIPETTGPMTISATLLLLAAFAALVVIVLVVYYRRARTE